MHAPHSPCLIIVLQGWRNWWLARLFCCSTSQIFRPHWGLEATYLGSFQAICPNHTCERGYLESKTMYQQTCVAAKWHTHISAFQSLSLSGPPNTNKASNWGGGGGYNHYVTSRGYAHPTSLPLCPPPCAPSACVASRCPELRSAWRCSAPPGVPPSHCRRLGRVEPLVF